MEISAAMCQSLYVLGAVIESSTASFLDLSIKCRNGIFFKLHACSPKGLTRELFRVLQDLLSIRCKLVVTNASDATRCRPETF